MAFNKAVVKQLMDWGLENESNRREAIAVASFMIATLNSRATGKQLSDQELDRLYSGYTSSFFQQQQQFLQQGF